MTGTLLALRIAARESRRRLVRSILVIVLVAVPVAAMTLATTIIRSENRGLLERYEDSFGLADLAFEGYLGPYAQTPEVAQRIGQVQAALPEGSEVTRIHEWYVGMRTDRTTSYAQVASGDLAAPILDGRYATVDGRLPDLGAPGEVAVSRSFAARFDVGAGDRLQLAVPDLALDVVGVIEDRRDLRTTAMYFTDPPPDALVGDDGGSLTALIDVPGELTLDQVVTMFDDAVGDGVFLQPRPVEGVVELAIQRFGDPLADQEAKVRWSIVAGALALAVVGIVIAAAFTVGARQQLATLGQLSANGAPESLRRQVLTFQGTVTGVVGSVVGVGAAWVGVRVGRSSLERVLNHRVDELVTRPGDVAMILAVGVLGASLAALLPARTAARIPTLQALAGRRPEAAVSHRLTVGGAMTFGAGLALLTIAATGSRAGDDGNLWAVVAIAGGVAVLFGATATTPALVAAVGPLARNAGGSVRLAVRNLTRHRTRTGAVVAAVAAAGSLAVGGTALARSSVVETATYTTTPPDLVSIATFDYDEEDGTGYLAPPVDAVDRVATILDGADRHPIGVVDLPVEVRSPTQPGYSFADRSVFVLDDAVVDLLRLDGAVRAALADDGIVVVKFEDDDETSPVQIALRSGQDPATGVGADTTTVPAQRAFSRYSLGLGSGVYVTPEFAAEHGLPVVEGPVVFGTGGPLDEIVLFDLELMQREQWQAQDGTTGFQAFEPAWELDYRYPERDVSRRVLEAALAGVATLAALIVLGIGLALAAADDREESVTMAVVGAAPSTRTRTTAIKAWIMAGLGFALAVPIGYLPVRVVQATDEYAPPTPFPFSLVAVLLLVAPLIGAAAAAAVAAIGSRLRPVRVSTAMFD